jgi:hypothetical protein
MTSAASTMNIISVQRRSASEESAFNSDDRKRLYKEAKAFLKTRAMRHKWVQEKQSGAESSAVWNRLKPRRNVTFVNAWYWPGGRVWIRG